MYTTVLAEAYDKMRPSKRIDKGIDRKEAHKIYLNI